VPGPSLFEPFIVRLERLGIPYFVTGSTAGIRYGEPRLTHDVDIVVALEELWISRLGLGAEWDRLVADG